MWADVLAVLDATYSVLVDLESYDPESEATQRRRRAATRIASNQS